jgi:hypothetical protein
LDGFVRFRSGAAKRGGAWSGSQVIPVVGGELSKPDKLAERRMSFYFGNSRVDAVRGVVAPEVKNVQGGLKLSGDARG